MSKNAERGEKRSGGKDMAGLAEADTEKSNQCDGGEAGVVSAVEIADAEQTSDNERQ